MVSLEVAELCTCTCMYIVRCVIVPILPPQRLRQAGVFISTSESVLFELLGDAKHPKFKEVQALIKISAPDSGLLTKL